MFTHSIFFKLNILFIIAIITTFISAFSITTHIAKRDNADLMFKARILFKEIRVTREKPIELIEEFNLIEVPHNKIKNILQKAKYHTSRDKIHTPHRRPHKKYKTLHYKGDNYISIESKSVRLLLQDRLNFWDRFSLPIFIFLGIFILLIVMYTLLRRSLAPLQLLQKDIITYGEGIYPSYKFSKKKDEISLLSNAFYQAVEKSKTLIESRKLFLRNIFHELNTPITKGKILAEILDEGSNKKMLDSIFTRLASLLQELAQMEEITSGDYPVDKKPIPVRELIDQARDWLYIDKEIESNITNETINVDFHLMSIVFKNLIDNGEKYGSDLTIIYDAQSISFISSGDKLDYNLEYFTQAFSKGDKQNSQQGFGLGLYIVHQVLQKHSMSLNYSYKDGLNIFKIINK